MRRGTILLGNVWQLSVVVASTNTPTFKVFGLGPGRSGTESLQIALTRLGFGPSYHMKEVLFEEKGISTSGHIELWHELARHQVNPQAINGENRELEILSTILEQWNSGTDWPLIAFPEELLKTYPDAKFILTTRPARQWYNSMSRTICSLSVDNWYMTTVRRLPFFPFNRFKPQIAMLNKVVEYIFDDRDFYFMCDPRNTDAVLQWYEDWNSKIKKTIPKKQLLIFQTGRDSYEKLASFLKVPVPNEPYPNSNSSNDIESIRLVMKTAAVFAIIVQIFLVSAIVLVIRRFMNRKSKIKDD